MIVKRKISFDFLVALMKGQDVVLSGPDDGPSVELSLPKDEQPENVHEALNKVEEEWDNVW